MGSRLFIKWPSSPHWVFTHTQFFSMKKYEAPLASYQGPTVSPSMPLSPLWPSCSCRAGAEQAAWALSLCLSVVTWHRVQHGLSLPRRTEADSMFRAHALPWGSSQPAPPPSPGGQGPHCCPPTPAQPPVQRVLPLLATTPSRVLAQKSAPEASAVRLWAVSVVVRSIVSLKTHVHSEPHNMTIFGKTVFADIIT